MLDWNVPDLDGVELLRWLRQRQEGSVPVIILSSRASERDVAGALGAGADDYVVKPFRPFVLSNSWRASTACWRGNSRLWQHR